MAKKKQTPKLSNKNIEDILRKQNKKKEPKVEEFMEIGGSPAPGITLRQILRGHKGAINRMTWSPDGVYLASPSDDWTVRIWDPEQGICIKSLGGHEPLGSKRNFGIIGVSWSPDGTKIAAGDSGGRIIIWNVKTGNVEASFKETEKEIGNIAWSPNGETIASVGNENMLRLWNVKTQKCVSQEVDGPFFYDVIWSPDGQFIFVGGNKIHLLDSKNIMEIKKSKKSGATALNLVGSWQNNKIISATDRGVIQIWDTNSLELLSVVEGHTSAVKSIALSSDEQLLISKSIDGTIRFWRTDTWTTVGTTRESALSTYFHGLALNPYTSLLATLSEEETAIRLWDINYDAFLGYKDTLFSIHYTTAKLVLVGDSGVGKTGLGWRLAHSEFKEHSSTHGQQFWVVPELKKTREDGTECEAVLWDLAGQPDYRLVHSLYLDDVDTALVLFDPTNRQEPLAGVDFWLNQLKDKDNKLRNSILIGARTDRGTSTLTDAEIQTFCKRNNVTGGYIATSAKEGKGLPQLIETLKDLIPWETLPATVTTVTFKRIKEYVLSLKEKTKRKKVLLQPSDLRKQLEKTDRKWEFSDAEMMTAVGHLEDHGYVKVLHGSNGEENILLSPDILANLASSIVLEARRNPRGLGVLEETQLLQGKYLFPELVKLSEGERKILLDAATVLFLEHNLCFRETFNEQTFLVFPSLINEKRPLDESSKTVEGETYQVKGAVENLYASMVVLLGYTNTFVRTHQWQNQAQYKMGDGEVCGFQQINYPDNSIELVLNYGEKTPDPVRLMFRGLFERFLSRRELEIARYQTVVCKYCHSLLARNVVLDQLNKGKKFTYCHECGKKVILPNPEPLTRLSSKEEVEIDNQQAIANYRTAFEVALVRVKGLLRDKKKKKKLTCFISYAWGVSENERWVLQLAKDLQNADIDVLLDRWHSPPGSNLDLYIDRILACDFVIPVCTPELRKKYDTKKADTVVAAELKLINLRVRKPNEYGNTVLPILLTGNAKTSFTPQLQPLVSVDFRETEFYFRRLFDMIWQLYGLPFDHPQLEELQESMTPQKR